MVIRRAGSVFALHRRHARQAACSVGWSEEGRCHRSAQRLRPTALVEAGGMVERGRLEALDVGVTHATIAVAVLFGEQENTARARDRGPRLSVSGGTSQLRRRRLSAVSLCALDR
jgi:hypothetical protein